MEKRKKKPQKVLALLLCGFTLVGLYELDSWRQRREIKREDLPPEMLEAGISGKNQDILLVNPWNPLPEDYEVGELITLSNGQSVSTACYRALMDMLSDCQTAGYAPYVCSGYRSEGLQRTLYETKVKHFMEAGYDELDAAMEAGKIVAVPGTSEHQTGLAVDLIDSEYTYLDEGQAETGTQQWLMENCWRYGFILRYPKGKSEVTGIIYEPWHYRYVGDQALAIAESGLCLEEYLSDNN